MMNSAQNYIWKKVLAYCLLLPFLFLGCDKTRIDPVNTYPDPPAAKVNFLDEAPNPSIGAAGSEVEFQVEGLEGKKGQFQFFINQTEAEVLEVTSETVTVVVPQSASTGGSSILIDEEYYFGPSFTVRGKVSMDPNFDPDTYKSDGAILEISEWNGTQFIANGRFTDYQQQASEIVKVPGIVILEKNSLSYSGPGSVESQFKVGQDGISGFINTVVPVSGGKFLLAGSISQYDTVTNINSITRINQDGSLDSMIVDVIGIPPLNKLTVPAFNGGVVGPISKVFYDGASGDITVIGNFFAYTNTFYERSSHDGLLHDFVEIPQVVRMKENGAFDSTFNYDYAAEKGFSGGNGFIYDAIQLSNGDFLLGGNFTSFHEATAGHIVQLSNTDGSVVTSFTGGTDGAISRMVPNPSTGNILLTGRFSTYSGHPANQVVMIDETGAIVPSFTFGETDGVVSFAGQMENGMIIVSGSFTRYNGVVREGLAFLNPDGTLASGYNSFGLFRGQINGFIETTTAAGLPAIILYGDIDKFDNHTVGNIVKIRFQN